jgi:hypothetical protein
MCYNPIAFISSSAINNPYTSTVFLNDRISDGPKSCVVAITGFLLDLILKVILVPLIVVCLLF